MNEIICSFGPHLKIIGIFYYANVLQEEKRTHKYTPNKNLLMKTHIFEQTKHQLQRNISTSVNFLNKKE